MHTHTYLGQTLRHDHPGGGQPHAYYGHEEDKGGPAFGAGTYEAGTSASPLADALAGVDHAQGQPDEFGLGQVHELAALRDLAEAVRVFLLADQARRQS